MQHLTYTINELDNKYMLPKNLSSYVKKEDIMIFDIETTGLSHTFHHCILIGFIVYEHQHFVAHQLFCDTRHEEAQILNAFINIANKKSMLISYNGHSFDIPFLNSRLNHHKIQYKILKEKNFDLLRLVRTQKETLHLADLKLKSLEKYLGINRKDTISGRESVHLYKYYEKSGDKDAKHKILLHNKEDIIYLLKCINIIDDISRKTINHFIPTPILINKLSYNEEDNQQTTIDNPVEPITIGYLSSSKILNDSINIDVVIISDFIKNITKEQNLNNKLYKNINNLFHHDFKYYGHSENIIWDKKDGILTLSLPIFTVYTKYETLHFVDVDEIDSNLINHTNFNELPMQIRMSYLVYTTTQKCSSKKDISIELMMHKTDYIHKQNVAHIVSTMLMGLAL